MQLITIEEELEQSLVKIEGILQLLNVPRSVIDRMDEKYGSRVVSLEVNLDNLEVPRIEEVSKALTEALVEYKQKRKQEMEIMALIQEKAHLP